ncbi:hypothetical protein D6D25_05739 [Aureobasidium pullulans]|nr:hypothetical protein D6D25_05739 [Aureobasidium pullulans]
MSSRHRTFQTPHHASSKDQSRASGRMPSKRRLTNTSMTTYRLRLNGGVRKTSRTMALRD